MPLLFATVNEPLAILIYIHLYICKTSLYVISHVISLYVDGILLFFTKHISASLGSIAKEYRSVSSYKVNLSKSAIISLTLSFPGQKLFLYYLHLSASQSPSLDNVMIWVHCTFSFSVYSCMDYMELDLYEVNSCIQT